MKKPKRPYSYKSFLTPPELKEALAKAARSQERSEAWIIKKALTEYLAKLGFSVKPSRR